MDEHTVAMLVNDLFAQIGPNRVVLMYLDDKQQVHMGQSRSEIDDIKRVGFNLIEQLVLSVDLRNKRSDEAYKHHVMVCPTEEELKKPIEQVVNERREKHEKLMDCKDNGSGGGGSRGRYTFMEVGTVSKEANGGQGSFEITSKGPIHVNGGTGSGAEAVRMISPLPDTDHGIKLKRSLDLIEDEIIKAMGIPSEHLNSVERSAASAQLVRMQERVSVLLLKCMRKALLEECQRQSPYEENKEE